MQRISKKTAAREAEYREFREQLKREVGHCEICGHDPERVEPGQIAWALHEHHIARGLHRQKAQGKRFAVLVLCYVCHIARIHGKVRMPNEDWPEARQLAALKWSRPQDYDLEAYNRLIGWGPDRITEEEVDCGAP